LIWSITRTSAVPRSMKLLQIWVVLRSVVPGHVTWLLSRLTRAWSAAVTNVEQRLPVCSVRNVVTACLCSERASFVIHDVDGVYCDVVRPEAGIQPVACENKKPVKEGEQQGENRCRENAGHQTGNTEYRVALQDDSFITEETEHPHKNNQQSKRKGMSNEQDLEQAAGPDAS
jgi:hypothetical protein